MSPEPPVPVPSALCSSRWAALCAGVAYFGFAWICRTLSPAEAPFVTFWLPSGIYLASLLLAPPRRWPWVVAAVAAANLLFDHLNGQPLRALPGFTLANSLEALAAATLVRRFVEPCPQFNQLATTLRFSLLVGLLAPAVGATIGTANISLILGVGGAPRTWLMWWTGDATGILLLAPLLLLWSRARWANRQSIDAARLGGAAVATVLTAVLARVAIDAELDFGIGLKYLAIPLVGFTALRFGLRSGLAAILIVGIIFALRTAGRADLADPTLSVHLARTLALQCFVLVLTVTILALGSLLEERRRREATLSESRALLRAIVDGTSDAVYVKDHRGRYILVNHAVCRIVGKPTAEILGRDDTALFPAPEAKTIMDGDRAVMAGTHPCTYEETVTDSAGSLRTYSSTKGPIRDAHGDLHGLFGIARDVTERKQAEVERAALTRAIERKNQELESLVYVTSHDLRSPLLNIHGFSERLKVAAEALQRAAATPEWNEQLRAEVLSIGTERIPKALGYIRSSIEKMERLIEGLLRLSRLGRADLRSEQLDLNRMFESIRSAMTHQLESAGASVEIEPLPPASGDAALLNQLFTNLLDNAVKYRDPVRPLQIHISGRAEGAFTTYTVADNGIGIPPEHLEKIWELFHRVLTANDVPGEGLGLSLVRRIVERHQGTIRVESEIGRGSRFIVALPTAPHRA